MSEMKTWNNGDSGKIVKEAIEYNFSNLDHRVSNLAGSYTHSFTQSGWSDNTIFIPYSEYMKDSPQVELYIKIGDDYTPVFGGYIIKEVGVELQTDKPYEGRVVIR